MQFECFRHILIIMFAKTTKLILKGKELACFCKNRPFSRREQHTCTKTFPIFLMMNSGYHNRNKKDRRDSPSSSSRPRSSSKTSAAVNNEANQ